MRTLSSLLVVLSVFLAGEVSHADAEENRLGVAGIGFLASTSEGGARGDAFAWGGRAVFGYGASNVLELRIAAGAAFAQALAFDGAILGAQQGNLFGDLLTIEASAGVRVNGGVWLTPVFARTRPFVELRGGALLRRARSRRVEVATTLGMRSVSSQSSRANNPGLSAMPSRSTIASYATCQARISSAVGKSAP